MTAGSLLLPSLGFFRLDRGLGTLPVVNVDSRISCDEFATLLHCAKMALVPNADVRTGTQLH
jgi:hypothetical protein